MIGRYGIGLGGLASVESARTRVRGQECRRGKCGRKHEPLNQLKQLAPVATCCPQGPVPGPENAQHKRTKKRCNRTGLFAGRSMRTLFAGFRILCALFAGFRKQVTARNSREGGRKEQKG